ncbi:MAG TPA: DUF1080 domain-containing protein [Planctomycetes bacterium]|nr:DUF1080 domain-containing protein [Planctomycetota bacterium]
MGNRTSVLIISMFILALLAAFANQSVAATEPLATITVEAGKRARIDTPVSIALDGIPMGRIAGATHLVEIKPFRPMPVAAQIEPGSPPRLWWILNGTTPAGSKRIYQLFKGPGVPRAAVEVTKANSVLQIRQGDTKVLQYNHAPVPPPEGKSPLYTRSGFIHPLWSPAGAVLTDIHPPDHIHHVGIWMPWTKTKFEGKDVDFWNLAEGQGTVRFVKFLSTTSGPVYGGFEAEQEHVALKTSEGEKVVLREEWYVRVYNIGGPKKGYWLWDFVSRQHVVADSPLHLPKYRYGGFGFRAAYEWEGENAMYLTSEGKTRKDGHATRARWCEAAGAIEGKWAGITFLSHPENFRHPEPMRIWPPEMKHLFFNWAPSQAGDWVMEPGKEYVFRYRQFVHEGKVKVADAERVWRDFGEPPVVKLERVSKAKEIVLFDGTDFSHWEHPGDKDPDDKKVKWERIGNAMKIVPRSGSIVTKEAYRDFKLHIEFKVPQLPPNVKGQGRGNSGVYIQRRYEIQILDSYGKPPRNNEGGSIYKFKAPDKNACKKPGEWQSYDITFRAARFEGQGKNVKKVKNARITVLHNGVLIHNDVDVPNKTGAGRPEGPEPGPILLQEHGNEVWFRNIRIAGL